MFLWHRYEARHLENDIFVVSRRGLFGYGTPQHRKAEWEGYTIAKGQRPDWKYLTASGSRSPVKARFGARRALIQAFRVWRDMLPAPWSSLPEARLLPP